MRRPIVYPLLFVLLSIAASCAVEQAPTGGENDTTPPEIIAVDPPHRSRYFEADKITFYFNEFIDPSVNGADIFISPLMELGSYEAYVYNKKLHIKFKDELKDSTTYIVTLGSKVKDFRGKNQLEKSIQYAFTTGDQLDSARVSGTVIDARTNQPMTDMNVLLFPADSIVNDTFNGIRPTYAAYTEQDGSFTLGYLKLGNYRILGLKDGDGNYQYNLPTEMIAVPDTPGIALSDTASKMKGVLYAFTPDATPPAINSTGWLNSRNIQITFNEEVVRIDSASVKGEGVTLTQTPGDPKVWYVQLPDTVSDSVQVQLSGVRDSVTNVRDTLLTMRTRRNAVYDTVLTVEPVELKGRFNPFEYWFLTQDVLDSTLLANQVALVDTANDTLPAVIQSTGHLIRVQLPDTLPSGVQPKLVFAGELHSPAGLSPKDSLLSLPLKLESAADFGALEGRVELADSFVNPILTLYKDEKVQFELRVGPFRLLHVPAGTYKLRILEDRDGNGRWSPGSLRPRMRHETVTPMVQTVEVKAGFVVEDVIIQFPEPEGGVQKTPEEEADDAKSERPDSKRPPGSRDK